MSSYSSLKKKFLEWVGLLPINWYDNINIVSFMKYAKVTYYEAENLFLSLLEENYLYLKAKVECKNCGYKWSILIENNRINSVYNCRECNYTLATNTDYWYQEIIYVLNKSILDNEEDLIGEIISPLKKIARDSEVDKVINISKNRGDSMVDKKIKVFISYSHKDKEIIEQLNVHLTPLKRQNKMINWYDGNIEAGQELDNKIKENLLNSDIILLMISANFIASEYCYCKEMEKAIELHKQGKVRVIPIIVKPVLWEGLPFSGLKALPDDGRPIETWENRDEAFVDIVKNINTVIKTLKGY